MAEIRIPTDRIPADILLRLQAIGQSVMNPVSNLVVPPSPSVTSTSTSPSKIVPSSSYSTTNWNDSVPVLCTNTSSGSSSPSVTSLASTTGACLDTLTVFPSSDRQKSLSCTEVGSPSKINEEKKETSFWRSTTDSTKTRTAQTINDSLPTDFCSDEVDGSDAIVHAFCESRAPHQVVSSCYDAVDDSDIVRIFPEKESTEKSGMTTGALFPSDESDIVRIFPNIDGRENEDDSTNLKEKTSPRRAEIVRALTPNRHIPMTSSLNFQHIESIPQKQRSSLRSDERCVNPNIFLLGSTNQIKNTPPIQEPATKETSPELNKSLYNHMMVSNLSPIKTSKTVIHNSITDNRTPLPENNGNCRNVINAANKNLGFITSNNPNSTNVRLGEMTPSKQLFLNVRREKTPLKYIRRSPPVSGHTRRSPELPTPPETPDDAQVDDDEVFSYDSVLCKTDTSSEFCDLSTFRQNLESTPRRDRAHLRINQEQSPNLRTVLGKRTSPFSPAQSLAEMQVGDRHLTKKRLSFDDDMPCQMAEKRHHSLEEELNQRNDFTYPSVSMANKSHVSLDSRSESPRPTVYNVDQAFASPKSLQHSPVESSQGHMPLHSASSQGQVAGATTLFKSTSTHHNSSVPNSSLPTSPFRVGSQMVDGALLSSNLIKPNATQSPVQETMAMITRILAQHDLGAGLQVNSPPRLRIHSDGDDVTDGQYCHAATEETGFCLPRPRGQTFSGYAKRRRIETLERSGRLDCSPLTTVSSHAASSFPVVPPTTSSAITTLSSTSTTWPTVSSSPHAVQTSMRNVHQPAEGLVESCACPCVKMERDLLKMAERAYKRIPRLDAPPNDFERFRQELAQTNSMLLESMAVVQSMKAICGHDKQIDRPLKDDS